MLVVKLESASSLGGLPGDELRTTVALSPGAFWRLAHSEQFYRKTRVPNGNVRQKVERVDSWVSPKVSNKVANGSAEEVVAPSSPARNIPGTGMISALFSTATPEQQQLQRKASLSFDVSSPFGTSKATGVQSMELTMEAGTITYSEASCFTGFPMMSKDLHSKITFAVNPSTDDPDTSMVLVSVSVDDVSLPGPISWLKGRIGKKMRKDLIQTAEKFLDAMAKEEAETCSKGAAAVVVAAAAAGPATPAAVAAV